MNNYNYKKDYHNSSRIWVGLLVLLAGILLLARKLGAPIPGWIFSWPMILIAIGLIIGIKNRFQNSGSLILILIGSVFFLDQNNIIDFKVYIVPVILILVGLSVIISPKGSRRRKKMWDESGLTMKADEPSSTGTGINEQRPPSGYNDEEYVVFNAFLGGIKKRVLSKNFKGGEIVTFMGGIELNFLNADLQHPVLLEVNNIFGGTKLLIPSNWDIKNEVSAIFGGVDDKRNFTNVEVNPQKIIHLKGTCLFGGIEISNF